MQYERFRFAGSDNLKARWYLIHGSYDLPQRLLVEEKYAASKLRKVPTFGRYAVSDYLNKERIYTYVVLNIFDIPFQDLDNFFVLEAKCDGSECSQSSEGYGSFGANVEAVFRPAASVNNINNITLVANQTAIAADYFSGLENLNQMNFNINMNVLPCGNPSTAATVPPPLRSNPMPSLASAGVNTCKRRRSSMSTEYDQPRDKQPTPPRTSTQIIEDIDEDDDMEILPATLDIDIDLDDSDAEAAARQDIPSVTTNGDLPSINPNPQMIEETPIAHVDSQKLVYLGTRVVTGTNDQLLGDEYDKKIVMNLVGGDVYASLYPRAADDNDSRGGKTFKVSAQVAQAYNSIKSRKDPFVLTFPALYSSSYEDLVINQLAEVDDEFFSSFRDVVAAMGADIKAIVEADNEAEFQRLVEAKDDPSYWLLYGLFRYMKNPNPQYTTAMEIMVSRHYGRPDTMIISDTFCRIYFSYTNRIKYDTYYTFTLNHLRRLELPRGDLSSNLDLTKDPSIRQYIEDQVVPIIKNNRSLTIDVDPTTQILRSEIMFGENILPIDDTLMYVYTLNPGLQLSGVYNIFLRKFTSPQSRPMSDRLRQRFLENMYAIMDSNFVYKGPILKSSQ